MGRGARRTLVFVHGIDGSAETAEAAARAMFGDRFRVVTYDLLGRGRDLGRRSADHSLSAYVRQLKAVVARQTAAGGGPVLLVGYSMGGAVAAAFAQRHPESVARLALLCPAGRISWTGHLAAAALPFRAWRAAVPGVLLRKMRDSYEGASGFGPTLDAKAALYADERFLRTLYETFRQFPLHDLRLEGVAPATLVIAAADDRVVPPDSVRELSRGFADVKVRTMKGTHALPFRRPRTVGRAVEAFFQS